MCSIQEVAGLGNPIEIKDSEVTIGRGPFLGVTDKRVSRNHGTLKRTRDGIELKSIHVNPCFYTKNSDEKWLKLGKNESVILHPGDTFSLLPKQCVYKVVSDSDIVTSKDDYKDPVVSKTENGVKVPEDPQGECHGKTAVAQIPLKSDSTGDWDTEGKTAVENNAKPNNLSREEKHLEITENKVVLNDSKNLTDDSAISGAQESVKHMTDQNSENDVNKCVKIRPNSSKAPQIKDTTENVNVKTPTYSRRGTAKTYMDGDKEVALPAETKRKLPSWMTTSKKDATPSIPSKKKLERAEKNSKITPKHSAPKKRRTAQNIEFDSDETPDELENEPQDGSKYAEEMTADEQISEKAEVTSDKEIENKDVIRAIVKSDSDVKKKVPTNDGVTIKDMKDDGMIIKVNKSNDITTETGTNDDLTTNNNDTTGEDVEMVDVSVAAKSMEKDTGLKSDDVKTSGGDNNTSPLKSDNTPTSASRVSCPYGSSCYRKNQLHFIEFSHPGDNDFMDQESDDESEKPECPYGTSCYRKNLVHQKQYKHTTRVAPKRRAKTKTTQNKGDDDSSLDDYDLDDSFLNDDDDEEDLDVTDGDSDWNPSQDSESQKVTRRSKRSHKKAKYQDSGSDDATTDEDLNDLVTDAKNFATNKKMWKK